MGTLTRSLRKLAVGAAASLLVISTSMSDDIDLYVAPPPEASVGETLVVFTLDMKANNMASTVCQDNECDELFAEVGMSHELENGSTTFFFMLVAALKKVLQDIDSHKIKVALMVSHANTGSCVGPPGSDGVQCSNGGYVLSAFKSTGDDPDTDVDESLEIDEFFEKLESIPQKRDIGQWDHTYQLKELFFEMYRYVSAGRVFNGQNGLNDFDTDGEFNIDDEEDTESVYPGHDEDLASGTGLVAELSWDPKAQKNEDNKNFYQNTLDTAEHCTDIFSVNVTFANAQQDNDSNEFIAEPPPAGFGFEPDTSSKGELQVLEYLANTDLSDTLVGTQNIRSYFVTVPGGRAEQANDWAQAGGTGSALVVEEDPNELVRLLSGLFNEIEGVSTTFVAASVPANVFNRAETLNEVFLAVFEPDDNESPFWVGNVKKLTTTTIEETVCEDLNDDGDTLDAGECTIEERKILVDVLEADEEDPVSAINPLDGRIRAGALTYWTETGTGNEYLPAPTSDEDEKEFTEGTDGRKVDRGGAGQVKPGYLGTGSPGNNNDTTSDTSMSGPRKIFTEADAGDTTSSGLVNLNADSGFSTAVNLLTDSRTYPGSSLSYGDFLFQTVMSDCTDCASSYGAATSTNQDTAELRVNNLIRFARGFDTGLDTAMSTTPPKRSWWQSDPLHTRPLALNYGARSGFTEDRPDIRVLVGGNDGMVQMIRDGRKSDGSEDGVEGWAFLPREFMPLQKRLLEGTLGLYNPGQPSDPPHDPLHPYAMDGAPTALVIDNNLDGTIDTGAGDKVYLFMGQRRGGKRYYALDISDPDNPAFLWSIGKDDGSAFSEMGQSWSLMDAGIMAVDEGGTVFNRPVLVFSGGYNGDDGGDGGGDLGKDSRVKNHPGPDETMGTDDDKIIGTDDDEGNALFIVNAATGELIWKAVGPSSGNQFTSDDPTTETILEHTGLVDSVAASPSAVDSDGDGLIDRVYFADTGGNVWRTDAGSPDRATWTVNKLFSGGRHFQADNANDRRFFNAPDVVFSEDQFGDFDAVILASGDRAHPLGDVVENWMYVIKDRNTTSGSLPHHEETDPSPPPPLIQTDLADLTDNCIQDDAITCESSIEGQSFEDQLQNGWRIQLEQCEAGGIDPKCGEKSLASPLTIEGTIFFTTYLPVLGTASSETPSTCGTAEGGGLFYALDLQTAGAVLNFGTTTSGDPDSTERFDKLASPGIPPEVVAISPEEVLRPDLEIQKTKGRPSAKTFWYERHFD